MVNKHNEHMTHSAAASIACCSSLSSLGLRYCAHSLFTADRCLRTLIKVSDLAVFHVLSRHHHHLLWLCHRIRLTFLAQHRILAWIVVVADIKAITQLLIVYVLKVQPAPLVEKNVGDTANDLILLGTLPYLMVIEMIPLSAI